MLQTIIIIVLVILVVICAVIMLLIYWAATRAQLEDERRVKEWQQCYADKHRKGGGL